MKGYKVFDPDWSCREFKYEVGMVYEMKESPVCCYRGFHFCEKLSSCFDYYEFNPNNKVAEIEALGEIDTDGVKSCTNKIKIVREITWNAMLNMVNEGKGCTGLCNTGNYNAGNHNVGHGNTGIYNLGNINTGNHNIGSNNAGIGNVGNRNTGNRNSGNYNAGSFNIGDCNTGCSNAGERNTGNYNAGNRNTGSHNIGNYNAGDWNKSSYNAGSFNTIKPAFIMMFNRPSTWTFQDWLNSEARDLLNQIPKNVVEWVYLSDMTDEEKAANPDCEATDGYLKILDESDRGQIWWDCLTDEQKDIIQSMPNFDEKIFEEITGIKI